MNLASPRSSRRNGRFPKGRQEEGSKLECMCVGVGRSVGRSNEAVQMVTVCTECVHCPDRESSEKAKERKLVSLRFNAVNLDTWQP